MTPLVDLNLLHVSTCPHHLHSPGISAAYRPRRHCHPLARVCVYLSSATTSIHVEPLAFYPPPRYLLSCPIYLPVAIISLSHQYLCLPLIRSTSKICHTYTPTYNLPLNTTLLYLYISIYLSVYLLSLTFSLLSLSLTLCLSLFLLNLLVSRPLTQFFTLYS